MENGIKVSITPQHFSEAKDYLFDCPLELALKEMFPTNKLEVGANYVTIDENKYKIPEEWGVHTSSRYTPYVIEQIIIAAKESTEDIPTIDLTLTKL